MIIGTFRMSVKHLFIDSLLSPNGDQSIDNSAKTEPCAGSDTALGSQSECKNMPCIIREKSTLLSVCVKRPVQFTNDRIWSIRFDIGAVRIFIVFIHIQFDDRIRRVICFSNRVSESFIFRL
jgi:hypothetical protein